MRLTREEAAAKAAALGLAPYDALLDGYEPGIGTAEIDALFEPLAAFLPDFLERVLAHQVEPLPLEGRFPAAGQKALGERLMARARLRLRHGRLDESAHPFCGGVPDDIRMTARYDESDAATGLMAILHETGHALYNAGLPKAWRDQPVGKPRSFAVHESQSLLIEMQICRSRPFLAIWRRCWPRPSARRRSLYGRQPVPPRDPGQRGLIRVDADEVTYPLAHRPALPPREGAARGRPPGRGSARGLERGHARAARRRAARRPVGCLQDIHWPAGAFGYFPCYTLGAILAAQLYEAMSAAEPDLPAHIARATSGRCSPGCAPTSTSRARATTRTS